MPFSFARVTCLLALLFCLLPGRAAAQNQDVVDEIVAVVGDQIILQSDVTGLAMNFANRSGTSYNQQLWNQALQELISQNILSVQAERDTTITVTPEQVTQALDRRIAMMAQQVGGEQQLEANFGKSITQIKATLRSDFRRQLLAQQLRSRKLQKVEITPTEVRTFFEEVPGDSLPEMPDMVRVSHIVRYPQASESVRQQTIDRLNTLRDSILQTDATFEEMARQYSEDPGSASSGGRIQGVTLDALVPEFAAVASRLEPGTISQVFRTTYGYHIMRVNERSGDVVDFNHILLSIDETRIDPSETVKFLSSVRDTLQTTDIPFEVMARRHSEEEVSAAQGGHVVNPQTGERAISLEALGSSWISTIENLEEDQISEPTRVQLLNGRSAYHIVQLNEFIPAHQMSLETDYSRIQQIALQRKQQRVLEQWINKLREDVYVDVKVDVGDVSLARQ